MSVLNGMNDGVTLQDVLAATYNDMNAEFQDRIEPLFEEGQLADFGKALINYVPGCNEFLYSLINHIALVNVNYHDFESPLKMFKKGMLEFGDTIEDVFIEPIKGIMYQAEVPNTNPGDVYETFKPDIDVVYYKQNREMAYPVTINESILRRAFNSYRDLDKFLSGIMQQLYNGDEIDDFALTMRLLANYGNQDGNNLYTRVHVSAVTDEASAKGLSIAVRSILGLSKFPTRRFNSKGVLNWAKPEDWYLLVTPEVNAVMDVDVLAKAFNMDKAAFLGQVVEVPGFGDLSNTVALLIHKEFLQIWDTLKRMDATDLNARHLTRNYYYHHHGILAACPFYPAIQFTTSEVTDVTAVEISGKEIITKGIETLNYTAAVTGGGTGAVIWSIVGSPQYASINQNGNLTVGYAFLDNKLTIKAASVEDSTVYDEFEVVVRAEGQPTKVTVSGDATITKDSSTVTKTYTATVTGDSTNSVKWSLVDNEDAEITINESTGVVSVTKNATAESIVVRATSTILTSLNGDKTVTIA